jgi:hypothetical protein
MNLDLVANKFSVKFGASAIGYVCCAVVVCLVVGIWLTRNTGSTSAISNNPKLPTLLNEKAIEHLRASGEYEPLAAALIKADYKVPSNGTWYRLTSPSNTFSAIQFGTNGDVPIPSAFVP